jgi:isopenicillin N synthase-like dioxygenase
VNATVAAVPVIDVSGLREHDPAATRRIAAELGAAARETGFFSIVNHGIGRAHIAEIFAAAKAFFALPPAIKEATALERSAFYRGYARLGFEKLDPALAGDAKESYNMGREIAADDPDVLAGKEGCNQWPDLPGFRDVLLAYYDACLALIIDLHRAVALDLGVPEDFFRPFYERPQGVLRLLRYPPHPGQFDGTRYGAAPHTDYGNMTLLAQDDAGGLEVRRRDGTWLAVAPVPNAFVCNIGDCLMRWSNDVYVSNPHRVVNASGRERYSVAFFGDPAFETRIACLPSCAGPERPARYAPITYAEHLKAKYEATYVG